MVSPALEGEKPSDAAHASTGQMRLDIVTLMAVAGLVTALAGLVLGGAWILMRERPLAWWSASAGVACLSLLFFIYGIQTVQPVAVLLGGTAVAFSTALQWAGARDFARRRVRLPALFAGTLFILLVAIVAPPDTNPLSVRYAGFSVAIAYLVAACIELWQNGKEPLRTRWLLIFLFLLHALTFAGGIVDGLSGRLNFLGLPLMLTSWFGLIHIESLIFWMGTAIFMLVLCKERSELRLQKAAGVDALTGAMTRGAFMSQAERIFMRSRKDGRPLALILVDLDRFKRINDTFGHRVGDQILTLFADSARACLRPTDLFARYGGEEFALLLPGAGMEEGVLVAERMRIGFIEACRDGSGGVAGTLSAGISEIGGEENFGSLLDKADKALYRAKNLGRNRIERAGPAEAAPRLIQVA